MWAQARPRVLRKAHWGPESKSEGVKGQERQRAELVAIPPANTQ